MSDGKVVFDITGNLSGIHHALTQATSVIARDTAKWTVLCQTAMNGLVSVAKAGLDGIKALAKNAFEYNASMETYEVNFKTLLGSAEAAQAKMVELKEYAAKTPFAFADLADATQTLLAFQLSSEDASLALKHLGDISLGDANKLSSLTLAFGQVSSAGKLAGQAMHHQLSNGAERIVLGNGGVAVLGEKHKDGGGREAAKLFHAVHVLQGNRFVISFVRDCLHGEIVACRLHHCLVVGGL